MSNSTQRHALARFSRLSGCMFGFFSENEVLKLSVCEIKELKGLSVLSLGEPNGLHDPRMGTLSSKQQEVCPTCNNDHRYCPGHIGHIRLTVPIYNPTIFKFIDAILTRKCYNCHHLLFDNITIQIIYHKLKTIDNGYIFDINSIPNQINKLHEAKTQKFTKQFNLLRKTKRKKKKKKKNNKNTKKHKKRHHGKLEQDSEDDDDSEDELGIDILTDMPSSSDDDIDDDIDDENDSNQQNDASSKPNLDFLDEGIMPGTRQSVLKLRWTLFELIFTKWHPLDQCPNCQCVRILFNRSDDCHVIQRPIGRRKKIYERSGIKLVNINDSTQTMAVDKDITIPVNDVQKHLEALWENEAFIMNRVFNTHPFQCGPSKTCNIDNNEDNDNDNDDDKDNKDNSDDDNHMLSEYDIISDWRQFFLKIIVVPPNRYRPPNFLGNRIAESSQNRQFRNILKANIKMKELIKQINELSANPLLTKLTAHKTSQHRIEKKKKWKEFKKSQREFSMKSIYDEENDEVNLSGNISLLSDDDNDDDDDGENDNKVFKEKKNLISAEALFVKFEECRKQFIGQWEMLQQHYNHLTDGTKNAQLSRGNIVGQTAVAQGIRQIMEKKQGLFRMFMMGKRVNYAARSVVNPELWIKTNEIGIPLYAAKILTFPERVQSYNYHQLREAIINGCDIHPGANSIVTTRNKLISLKHKTKEQRKAIARRLLSNISMDGGSNNIQSSENNIVASKPQIVYRHIRNNDIVLVNRQPTLHKVSIMAHRVRVQHHGKVIRMHYANCNSYNADFDGDEINVHFPQSEIARSEAYNIASTPKQYISVKDGSPLRGLMQDHVVSSVLLTKKDTFITKNQYIQLLFSCMQSWNPSIKIKLQPPTIIKPKVLWTGKQVINTLLDSISGDLNGINMEKKTRTPANAWNGIENNNNNKEEGMLIIRDNYICQGILDKSQISDGQSFGLIHAIHELYGSHATSTFLTSLGQLLSTYLQSHGFSARMEDLILMKDTEIVRRNIIKNSFKKSVLKTAEAVGYNINTNNKPSLSGITSAMKDFLLNSDKNEGKLDGEMRGTLASITNNVIGKCYPFGSLIPFPVNNFQLMILAGAKGSTVNMAQIVAGLGQQELEGHRVPRMISGKTLPCFNAYDPCGRAGGFVTQRFLTGLRPQEYYFHSMAGREGLVDTACKTSRSGYLQRCLIKGLETLHISYDNTVRDCNQNIIQFLYGEDSLDTSKASYLDITDCKKYSFFAKNKKIIEKQVERGMFNNDELKLIFNDRDKFINKNELENKKKIKKILNGEIERKNDDEMDFINARLYMLKWWKNKKKNKNINKYDPCINIYDPSLNFGAVSESYFNRIKQFIKTFDSENRIKSENNSTISKNIRFLHEFGISNKDFEELMKINYVKCLVSPGEMVGILAAQSIGEPSTQMTLNTFHLAGFGERNVTLGIPRMREILMTEGKNIKTPDMTFWISPNITKPMEAAIKLKNALEPLCLSKLLTSRTIQGPHVVSLKRIYTIELTIAVPNALKYVTIQRVLRCLQKQFLPTLLQLITKSASRSNNKKIDIDESQNIADDEYNVQENNAIIIDENEEKKNNKPQDNNDDDDDDEDEDEDIDIIKSKTDQDGDYSDNEEEEEEEHSDEEKDSSLDDESVLFGLTAGGATDSDNIIISDTDNDDMTMRRKRKKGEMPDLVTTTTDDDFSDSSNDRNNKKRKRKRKRQCFKDNDKLQQELNAKYKCFRSVQIAIDEPRILCSMQIELPLNHEPVLLESLIDSVCKNYAFIRKINNISAVHIVYDKKNHSGSNWKIIISGFNKSVFKLVDKWVDLSSFETNDIYQTYQLYGIEAARNAIINQLLSVLGAYGLDVSYRHLSLIADSMTYFGEIRPMTRKSMSASTSPFLRITYEMAQKFLIDSCLNKDIDNISSPSSAIILGQVGKFGTGLFKIKQDIEKLIEFQKQQENEQTNTDQLQSYYSDEDEDDDDQYNQDNDDEYY